MFDIGRADILKKIIYHVDVNSAFLSWEATYRIHHLGAKLDLRTIPAAVGGDQEKRHGIILAKSLPCKKYGIQTGESVAEAKRKCPELVLVPPNYELYNKSSKAFVNILRRYTDRIEQYSIDECWMDMTGCTEEPEKTAIELKDTIKQQLGFTVNVGVSENKLLAKMASELRKPDMVHTLWRQEIPEKMWPLHSQEHAVLDFIVRIWEGYLDSNGIEKREILSQITALKANTNDVLVHWNKAGNADVYVEAFASALIRYAEEHIKYPCFHRRRVEGSMREKIDEIVMYDNNAYYLPATKFNEVVKMMETDSSRTDVKGELARAGLLYTEGEGRNYYTVKVDLLTTDAVVIQKRRVKLDRKKLDIDGEMTLYDILSAKEEE